MPLMLSCLHLSLIQSYIVLITAPAKTKPSNITKKTGSIPVIKRRIEVTITISNIKPTGTTDGVVIEFLDVNILNRALRNQGCNCFVTELEAATFRQYQYKRF